MQHPPIAPVVEQAIRSHSNHKGPITRDFDLGTVPGGLGCCNHIAIIVDVATAKGVCTDSEWSENRKVIKRGKEGPPIKPLVDELTTAGRLNDYFLNGRR